MLLGYWSNPTNATHVADGPGESRVGEVVVLSTIGAGPQARRGATWLKPDHEWQLRQLEDVYVRSGRTVTYLGDWHTHPGGTPVPSWRDRRTLRAVRRSARARAPRPLMMIVGPEAESPPVLWYLETGRHPVQAPMLWFTPG